LAASGHNGTIKYILPKITCAVKFYPFYLEVEAGRGEGKTRYGIFLLANMSVPPGGTTVYCDPNTHREIIILQEGNETKVIKK
jgi:hypothetical protein